MRIKLGKKDIYAIVDDDFVNKPEYCFSLTQHGYPRANIYTGKINGKYQYKYVYLHHLVLGKPPKGLVIDHINRNKLDNRKSNLRFCVQSSNAMNKTVSSGYKGVHYNRQNAKFSTHNVWVAQITANYKKNHLGVFKTAREAALAYNKAAKKIHGKYAVLNKV